MRKTAFILVLLTSCLAAQTVGPNLNLTKASGNQYETSVAVNPADNNQIFVVSRNEKGGLYTARTIDGGVTWTSQLIATTTLPKPGDIPRAYGNASAAWDSFGNLFVAYLSKTADSGSSNMREEMPFLSTAPAFPCATRENRSISDCSLLVRLIAMFR